MRPSQLLSALLCTSAVSAFAWKENALQVADLLRLDRRAPQVQTLGDSNAASPNPSETISSAAATDSSAATTGDSDSSNTAKTTGKQTNTGSAAATTGGSAAATTGQTSGTNTAKSTGAGKSSGTGSKTTGKTSTTAIDPRDPAGGISMITPNVLSQTSYYKVGNYITFAWNYTSLSVTPSAIDILASCSLNQATYTLALNQSISGQTQAITWDTGNYQSTATQQLVMGTYTLIIYDANSSVSATPSPGYLGAYNQFTFGMYTPQPYTPLNEYVCATCGGAASLLEKQTVAALGIMGSIAAIAFTSFLGGAGVIL